MIYDDETINEIQLYKGKYYDKKRSKSNGRVIAFDLDETLGSFTDLEILWSALQHFTKKYSPIDFNTLLDLYPEFLRYGIIHIIEFLVQKKKTGQCKQIFIYTNNKCNHNWVDLISTYFNYKLNENTPIFDKIIRAFRIGNKRIEPHRTSTSKTFPDFIKCTLLPVKTEICFIDNCEYKDMKSDRVYYIQPYSYTHHLSTQEIIKRFVNSDVYNKLTRLDDPPKLHGFIADYFLTRNHITNGNPRIQDLKRDITVAQKIMYHLKEFFYLTTKRKRTQKNRLNIGHTTRKNLR
jgi:hypothetical protein|tara:strand:+ start:27 stop:902 length:876 start_codon:yes stop_codon:yes gene_type:complete